MASSIWLVVATRVRGVREAFRDSEELLFVPMHDADAVAEAVRRLAAEPDLRQRLIVNAFARARETTMERTIDHNLEAMSTCWAELGRVSD